MSRGPLVIAHRGGAGEAPENTLPAFRRALDLGCDGVECDVHLSRDGAVVVHHDPEVTTAEGAAAAVRLDALALAEIRNLDLGRTHGPAFAGLRIPTLEEFLDLPPAGREVMIEMKGGGDEEGLGRAVARILARHRLRRESLCGSFSARLVAALHRADPGLRIQAIADRAEALDAFAALPIEGVALDRRIVTPELVAAQHRAGRKAWSWTVKLDEHVPPLRDAGIDALITDRPEGTLRYLGR